MNSPPMWSCPAKDHCSFVGKEFCGHQKTSPIVRSYHGVPGTIAQPECYLAHAFYCWQAWLSLQNRYKHPVKRILDALLDANLDEGTVQRLIGIEIIHHDIGKLTQEYQLGQHGYRHELLSAVLLYDAFKAEVLQHAPRHADLIAAIFSASVYLHHEGLHITQRHLDLRAPSYSFLLSQLSGQVVRLRDDWWDITQGLTNALLVAPLKWRPQDRLEGTQIAGETLAKQLGEIIVTVDGYVDPLAIRLAVAATAHPLKVCDNLSARSRGGAPGRFSQLLSRLVESGAVRVIED
ncbi:MAG: HD domain-containing protein [Candidatus Methanomethyliaceae archaeon]